MLEPENPRILQGTLHSFLWETSHKYNCWVQIISQFSQQQKASSHPKLVVCCVKIMTWLAASPRQLCPQPSKHRGRPQSLQMQSCLTHQSWRDFRCQRSDPAFPLKTENVEPVEALTAAYSTGTYTCTQLSSAKKHTLCPPGVNRESKRYRAPPSGHG
jgi:hypothetical protein